MVDRFLLARHLAEIRDAIARIREVLPAAPAGFAADRTAREVVVLNLFVALQQSLSMATHWLADAGLDVPGAYREVFLALGSRGVVSVDLAQRLAAAAGLRNLIAHRYGALDWYRIHEVASTQLEDLLELCAAMERVAGAG